MNVGLGVGLIVAGTLLGLLTAFGLRTRLPSAAVLVLLALVGAAVGAGALLVQTEASTAEWIITVVVLAIMTPLHLRLIFGPSSRSTT